MQRLFGLIWIFFMMGVVAAQDDSTNTPPPRPIASGTLQENGITAELYFPELIQGNAGVVRLSGTNISDARALFMNRDVAFIEVPGDGWYAIIVALIDAQPRNYMLTIFVRTTDRGDVVLNVPVTVSAAGYISQRFSIPASRAYLTEPEVERREFARIEALTASVRPERLWGNDGFQLPVDAEFTSDFGQYRVLNNNIRTRHTGWDQNAAPGTSVMAIAGGEVVYAGALDIRGNYVLIDHGFGVYSGYAHFSQLNVQRGQSITKGQVIGLSGNTGRSSGPHLHWEININGEWVNAVSFIEMWLP